MRLKKVLAAASAAIISMSAVTVMNASAADTKDILLLGDSIAYGYNASFSFGEVMNDYLGGTYDNLAFNGQTTSQLLDRVKTNDAAKEKIANTDNIIISIGANDYLKPLKEIIDPYYTYKDGDTFDTIKNAIAPHAAELSTQLSKLTSATAPAIDNISSIVNEIRILNPDADITFLNLYNPLENIGTADPVGSLLTSLSTSTLDTFNTKLSIIDNIKIASAADGFKNKTAIYTNMANIDPHPNNAGQIKIAALALEKVTGTDYKTVLGTILGKLTDEQLAQLPADLKDSIEIIKPEVTTPTSTATAAPETTTAAAQSTTAAATTTAAGTTTTAKTTTASAKKTTAKTTTKKVTVTSSPKTSDSGLSVSLAAASFASAVVIGIFAKRRKK